MSGLRRITIVGASLAGLRAAETLRQEGFEGALTIVGAEDRMPYDRPPLSKELLTGAMEVPDVALRISDDLDAEWVLGDAAVALDLAGRAVDTAAGRRFEFDGLVIATGSVPRRLPGLEPGSAGIKELRNIGDSLALREALAARPRLMLVGCGFIGVELASAATAFGCEVDVVTLDPPLAIAGQPFSDVCAAMLADAGARVHVGRAVADVVGEHGVESVILDDGHRIEAELIVVAVGARPVTEWLEGSGLELDDGIVCDASSACIGADRVVAAGDVARWPNQLFDGVVMRIEHWSNAVEQGMAAARTLLHGSSPETAFTPVPSFWSDHFGTRLQSVGIPGLADRVEIVAGSVEERRFVAAAWRGEDLVGAATYGMVRELAKYRMKIARDSMARLH